jgi:hypothetical protein
MQNKNVILIIIIVLAVGAGAFYGGTLYEKNKVSSQGMMRGNGNFPGGRAGQANGPGGPGRGAGQGKNGSNGNFTVGQIVSKDDKSITIKTSDNGSKIIFFTNSTTVGRSVSGSPSDLNSGQNVMVNGTANPDGSLSAQNIQIRPGQPNQ